MWVFPTSMRPVARRLVVVALAAIAVVAGFAGGWIAHAPPPAPGTHTLAILAAGSLAPTGLLPALALEFAAQTPGVSAPVSAQLYEGSNAAATALAGGGQPYDLFVSADFRVIPTHLEPPASGAASWEIVFAADPLVLAYDARLPAFANVNSTNWYQKIVAPGVVLGTPNASADPLGAAAILALELEDAQEGLGGALYAHFFSGPQGGFATPTASTRYVAENVAQTALATGEVGAYLIYRSYAVVDHLSYVPLAGQVDLGSIDPTNVSRYAQAVTTVLSGSTQAVVHGAPSLFALTVPSTAPDAVLGVAFAAFLLSNATSALWAADGFVPIHPAFADHPSSVPAALSGTAPDPIVPLPADLAALLG